MDYRFQSSKNFQLEYTVSSESLGKGGFGVVFAGTRKIDGQKVAIKRIPLRKLPPEEKGESPDSKVPQEIQILSLAQDCPGVIRLYDFWRDETDLVIVMKRNENALDLISHMGKYGVFDEAEAANMLRQLVRTLVACHKKKIFHRDVKLENILFDRTTGEMTLIDFGCGEILDSLQQQFWCYIGTPDYVPPEVYFWKSFKAEGATVWSVGVIAFMIVFGYKPFSSKKDLITNTIDMEDGIGSKCCRKFILDCLTPVPEKRPTLESLLDSTFLVENVPRISESISFEDDEENMNRANKRSWQKERNEMSGEIQTYTHKNLPATIKMPVRINALENQTNQKGQPKMHKKLAAGDEQLRGLDVFLKEPRGETDGELSYITRNPKTTQSMETSSKQNIHSNKKRLRELDNSNSTGLPQSKIRKC